MPTIIFYENTSTMQNSTITMSSRSLRLAYLSPGQGLPPLPVNFLLGVGEPCLWSVVDYNLFLYSHDFLIMFVSWLFMSIAASPYSSNMA